jgi:thiol:disulfide interchange protein
MTQEQFVENLSPEPRMDSRATGSSDLMTAAVVGTLVLMSTLLFGSWWLKMQPPPTAANAQQAFVTTPALNYIEWNYWYEDALQRARTQKKPVMIEFYTDWCGVCRNMDVGTFRDPKVIAEAQNFISLKINAEHQRELANKYGVSRYPTFVYTDGNGTVLTQEVGGPESDGLVSQMQTARSFFSPV